MSVPRFFCPMPLQPGASVALPDAVARHAVGVLRLRPGDAVVLFNGDGVECSGRMLKGGKGAEVRLMAAATPERESPLDIELVQGVSSGERMDFTLQKAVELGVAAIQPVLTRRSVVRLDADKRQKRRQHWQGVAISACEQCGRNRVPAVAPVLEFADWLATCTGAEGLKLILDPAAEHRLRDLPPPRERVRLLAGPEGGFDPAERQAALQAGFRAVALGPRILRTETAALAAMAAMQSLWGDF